MPRFDSDLDYYAYFHGDEDTLHQEDAGDACPCDDCYAERRMADGGDAAEAPEPHVDAAQERRP